MVGRVRAGLPQVAPQSRLIHRGWNVHHASRLVITVTGMRRVGMLEHEVGVVRAGLSIHMPIEHRRDPELAVEDADERLEQGERQRQRQGRRAAALQVQAHSAQNPGCAGPEVRGILSHG